MKFRKLSKLLRMFIMFCLCLVLLSVLIVSVMNIYVKTVGGACFLSIEEAADLSDVDCIIVLGCQVRPDGSLSDMLHDRLYRSVELYQAGVSEKLLVSGDHGGLYYNEVGAMKRFATDNGVPSENVFMDHAGFSTYETMYRAKEIFQARKVVIVTQEYHLYRAVYIAKQLGMEAYGVSSDLRTYIGQSKRDVREILARCKDVAMCVFEPEPTHLGEEIPISGNGDVTNDKEQTKRSR